MRWKSIATAVIVAGTVCATDIRAAAQSGATIPATHDATTQDAQAQPFYYDLGEFHRPVATRSKLAQNWFDRGLAMCYGFNHEEAVRCFERAYAEDPELAMALWGMAYAWGANINNPEVDPNQLARASLAVRLAQLTASFDAPLEKDLVDALSVRYVVPVPEDRTPQNQAYADAMRRVYQKHPDSALIAGLFAESLMILRPWKHWSSDGEPAPETPEIVAVLEASLARWPDDPMLCHLYIHAMEASPTPEKALPAADRLRNAMPGSGHLTHMPSHIDVLLGRYDAVIEANQKAIAADGEFLRREGPNNFYTLYRLHNFHFLTYGAMFDGQSQLALSTAREIVRQVPEKMLRAQSDALDAFMPTALHVLVRFGRWDDVLAEPEPAEYLPVSRSIRHYARALAYAATARLPEARQEQTHFLEARKAVPETSTLFQNKSRDILGVAEAMLAGEIAYRAGEFDAAFAKLGEAVRRDDALNYDEPWGWMQPARHALGALLAEQGRFAEAEAVYRADLKRHPNNAWALHGLAECVAHQGRAEEAAEITAAFDKAAARCDVPIDRSCYCRTMRPAAKK